MGCSQAHVSAPYRAESSDESGSLGVGTAGPHCLETLADDVITSACVLGTQHFVAAGVDGWVYFYDWITPKRCGVFRPHRKATNCVLTSGEEHLFTASADTTVQLWKIAAGGVLSDDACQDSIATSVAFQGHDMSVSALEVVTGGHGAETLVTGSRDCSVRCWDVETGVELQRAKILRNVVLALRHVPFTRTFVQSSEDLKLRLWDLGSSAPVLDVHSGSNQLVCMDVTSDGRYVICGSKGFSRENCEVKVFDVRGGLRALASNACADQTVEALTVTSPEQCLIAGKDGFLRCIALPDVTVTAEWCLGTAGCTALAVQARGGDLGPVALAALAGPEGPHLKMLEWVESSLSSAPVTLACTA